MGFSPMDNKFFRVSFELISPFNTQKLALILHPDLLLIVIHFSYTKISQLLFINTFQ